MENTKQEKKIELENGRVVEIKDFDNKYKFKIKLFNVEDGLKFYLKTFNESGLTEEKIEMLLKQAILLYDDPNLNKQFSLGQAKTIFENPMSIIKLATEVKEFQDVFLEDFKI